jgi:hypothetical protein
MPIEFTLAKHRLGHLASDSDWASSPAVSTADSLQPVSPAPESSAPLSPDAPARSSNVLQEGLVIISEFVSSSRVMRGAFVVNPWRLQEVMYRRR